MEQDISQKSKVELNMGVVREVESLFTPLCIVFIPGS